MKNTLHELDEEFPEHLERMHALKASDAQFARLFDSYHDINRAVLRAENEEDPVDDAHLDDLRRKRVHLKDEIYARLTQS